MKLVDLRVGNKPETFAGETHEWKGWSFKMRQYIAAVDEELYLELVNVEANQFREMPLADMNEPQKKTTKTACVHADDAHERSCTPDDHETERSSEWIRNLVETFSGRVGASTQRTVQSDADAISAVSVCGRCVGCNIVQADHAPEAGVAQGIFHGILVRHHGRIQAEVEEGLEKEVERQEEEDNTQEQMRMTMTMDEMERHCEALEPM